MRCPQSPSRPRPTELSGRWGFPVCPEGRVAAVHTWLAKAGQGATERECPGPLGDSCLSVHPSHLSLSAHPIHNAHAHPATPIRTHTPPTRGHTHIPSVHITHTHTHTHTHTSACTYAHMLLISSQLQIHWTLARPQSGSHHSNSLLTSQDTSVAASLK